MTVFSRSVGLVYDDDGSGVGMRTCWRTSQYLISKLFQLNSKHRRSGMDRRNLGSMDGMDCWLPCNLDSGIHAGMTE